MLVSPWLLCSLQSLAYLRNPSHVSFFYSLDLLLHSFTPSFANLLSSVSGGASPDPAGAYRGKGFPSRLGQLLGGRSGSTGCGWWSCSRRRAWCSVPAWCAHSAASAGQCPEGGPSVSLCLTETCWLQSGPVSPPLLWSPRVWDTQPPAHLEAERARLAGDHLTCTWGH